MAQMKKTPLLSTLFYYNGFARLSKKKGDNDKIIFWSLDHSLTYFISFYFIFIFA